MSKTLKVLLVEDSEDDRDLVLMRLRTAGFEVSWRQVSSAKMLREALAEPWELILCDYHMPGFEAPEALAIIKDEAQLDTPVIIVSGILGEEAAVVAMKAGAHDFFSKNKLTRLGAAVERELAEAENRKARRKAEADKERLLRDLQLALQVRDEFLVIASHELRTPLTSLRLQVDSLARAQATARARGAPEAIDARKLGRLDSQLDRLSTMVERLLDVTTLSSEPLRLLPTPIDLGQLVHGIVERSRDALEDSGCQIDLHAAPAPGWWDPVRLDTVVTDLLSNAVKFGAGKPVTLAVWQRGDHTFLSVQDRGMGMSPDERARVFQKFARVVPKENYGGFGLGLWIVDQVVHAHGGSVEVASNKGEGATFTVILPTNDNRPAT